MNLSDVKSLLKAELLTSHCNMDQEVHSAFSSDMMSNVLAYANNKSILITGLYNPQVLRTAEMMGIACIVFIGRREPDESMISLADEMGICVLLTRYSMFTTCGKLYCAGMNGGVPSER